MVKNGQTYQERQEEDRQVRQNEKERLLMATKIVKELKHELVRGAKAKIKKGMKLPPVQKKVYESSKRPK